nr:immunoglobulin heavy chain junction region [Macaca mulatta]MOV87606.1 immunoglobulin heavy chain junction region [Macaca mulatta]MOV88088.1 immunoglobulin heavy chain junction region [Macaca mulatta]MOV88251.1 immunoglobulin heavy chain junction region [Macaca mulatta]MOV88800.1 immunoglobulin heavy chain junction region [Macaca mulatta]
CARDNGIREYFEFW